MNQEEFIGKKYGRLTILSFNEPKIYDYGYKMRVYSVNCICECGKLHTTDFQALKKGSAKSCGCYSRERAKENFTKHGLAMKNGKKRPEYTTWQSMKKRCLNPNSPDYKHYGGRGITVCDEWKDSFENFFRDMGERLENYSIERIDVNKGYYKENCEWIPKKDQPKNLRGNQIKYNGRNLCLTDWCKELNLPYQTMRHRVYDLGMSMEEAVIKPRLAKNFPRVGEQVHNSILKESQVIEILTKNEKTKILAERYGVSREIIRNVKRRKTWKHIKIEDLQ